MTPYRDSPLEVGVCPRCVQPSLSLHARRADRVLACRTCGGIFAERDTVLRMLDGKTEGIIELAEEATRAPPNPKLVPLDLECPRCGILMVKVHVRKAQVPIDICAAHGVWFDRWEAQLVAAIFQKNGAAWDPETVEALRDALFPT